MERGSDCGESECSVMLSAGSASATMPTSATRKVRPGFVVAGRSSAGHSRGSRVCVDSRHRNGTRGLSILLPSLASSAGSTVSEPSTAIATTRIEPMASEAKVMLASRNRPIMDTSTAMPDTSTEWPEVSAAISIASMCCSPRARSSRTRLT
jgi:hypothetical protein